MKTSYAFRKPVVNAYLVRERDRRRWRDLVLVLAVAVPIAVVLLVYTSIRVGVLEAGYRVGDLERELYRLEQTERRLRLEGSRLSDAARIESLAESELGLVEPTIEQMAFVGESP